MSFCTRGAPRWHLSSIGLLLYASAVSAGQSRWVLLFEPHADVPQVAASRDQAGTIYAAGGPDVLSISNDFGRTWRPAGLEPGEADQLIVSRVRPETVYVVAGGRLVLSSDHGATWNPWPSSLPGAVQHVTADLADDWAIYVRASVRVVCPRPGGIWCFGYPRYEIHDYQCPDGQGPCAFLEGDLFPIFAIPGPAPVTFASWFRNGMLYRVDSYGKTGMGVWNGNLTQIQIQPDAEAPDRLYGLDLFNALYRSDDRGIHWTLLQDPRWIHPPQTFAADPVHGGKLYVSVEREVFVSSDAGDTWSTLGATPAELGGILSLAVSADGTTLYGASTEGVSSQSLCDDCPLRVETDRPPTHIVPPRP